KLQSYQSHLASKTRFGVALGRTALHAPDPRQAPKCLVVEPLFGTLTAKVSHQQLDLARERRGGNRHVDIRLPDIAIPLRDLIFQNLMIAEGIPRQPADRLVILMRIVAPMGEDQVGIDPAL